MSNNIGVTTMAANQASPEVNLNNQTGRIDAAVTETLAANLAAGNFTPTLAQIQQAVLILASGVATSGRQVILTNCTVKKVIWVDNPAASTNSIAVVKGTKTVPVQPGEQVMFYLDGTADYLRVVGEGRALQYFPSNVMIPRTTAGSAALAAVELATNRVMVQTLDFDQTIQEFAQFTWMPPRGWNKGTVTAVFHWTAAAGTGGVAWALSGLARSDGDVLDTAFGTAIQVTDTLIATNDEHRTAETAAITIGGTPIEDDRVIFQVQRNPADAADTLTADAKLLGISLFYDVQTPTSR